jgi:hypothetical protein
MTTKSSHLLASTCSLVLSLSFLALNGSAVNALGATKGQKIRYVPPKDLGVLSVSIPGIFRGECIKDPDDTCFAVLIPNADPNSNTTPLTISNRPTFFLNIPKGKTRAEFTLSEINGSVPTKIYKIQFPLARNSGLIAFTLPSDAPVLKLNKIYAWRFTVSHINNDKDVFGTIRRVEVSPGFARQLQNSSPLERAALFASLGIWYDSVKILADLQQANPNRKKPLSEWIDLLRSVDLEQMATQPFVSSRF